MEMSRPTDQTDSGVLETDQTWAMISVMELPKQTSRRLRPDCSARSFQRGWMHARHGPGTARRATTKVKQPVSVFLNNYGIAGRDPAIALSLSALAVECG